MPKDVMQEQPERKVSAVLPFPVVGLGASAGGLRAFQRFLEACPPDTGMAFIVIQHLDPRQESYLPELLGKHTPMEVHQACDDTPLKPNTVYVIPPGKFLRIDGCRLQSLELFQEQRNSFPVDYFLHSLAENAEESAIGIILSGIGTDGSSGIRSIKRRGGLAIAQSPEEAEYDEMPRRAMSTGLVDLVLPIKFIPAKLMEYVSEKDHDRPLRVGASREYEAVLHLIQRKFGHDFSQYKTSTLLRRIKRRMGLNHQAELSEYRKQLEHDPGELNALFNDVLIGVTCFFRDKAPWETLAAEGIAPLLSGRKRGTPVRAWVAGCATGQEAYSLAMLLIEQLERARINLPIQVFATDIDDIALSVARAGRYPSDITDEVTPARLRRFFDRHEDSFQVKKELRDTVVFARQNLISDPPFSQLDIVSCRNVLIYLEPELQRRVLRLFHFSLRDKGVLLLGSSETIGRDGDLFEPVNKRSHMFRRTGPGRSLSGDLPLRAGDIPYRAGTVTTMVKGGLSGPVRRFLSERYAPPSLLADRYGRVRYLHGAMAGFLTHPTGEPTQELMDLVHDSLRHRVRGIFRKAVDTNQEVTGKGRLNSGNDEVSVTIRVSPFGENSELNGLYLISFEEAASSQQEVPLVAQEDGEFAHVELEKELNATREELEATIRELAVANEELQTANEEALSSNEELQSTNEELETSKEELQSLNEELNTVNGELQQKVDELERAKNDVTNLLKSTNIAIVFLDSDLRIKWYTSTATRVLNIIDSDVGRPISDLKFKLRDEGLLDDAARVMAEGSSVEEEIEDENGQVFLRRILPYRTQDERVEGVVLTFTDITRVVHAETALAAANAQVNTLLHSMTDGFITIDRHCRCTYLNPSARELLNVGAGEEEHPMLWRLLRGADHTLLRRELSETISAAQSRHFELFVPPLDLWLVCFTYPVPDGVALFLADNTVRKREALRQERLVQVLSDANTGYWELRLNSDTPAEDLPDRMYVSATYLRLTGRKATSAEETAVPWEKDVFGEDLHAFKEALQRSLSEEGGHFAVEYRIRHADGHPRWLHSHGVVGRDGDGRPVNLAGFTWDVTEHKHNEEVRARLAAIVDASADAIISTTVDGVVTSWNKGAEAMYGYSAEFMAGESFAALFPLQDQEVWSQLLQRLLSGESVSNQNCRRIRQDGTLLDVSTTASPITDKENVIVGLSVIEHDITEQKRIERNLRRYSLELEEANRDLESFSYSVSHDLRAPLRAIDGFSNILLEEYSELLGDDGRQLLHTIHGNTIRMAELIEDLLGFSRVGRKQVEAEFIDMNQLAREVLVECQRAVDAPHAEVRMGSLPPAHGDRNMIRLVLANLLSNAFKFTAKQEQPWIELGGECKGGNVVYYVKDNGAGFDMRYERKLFGVFQRLHHDHDFAGTGVGLAIVNRIVTRHGGRVWAEGEEGKGATFYFALPDEPAVGLVKGSSES